MSVQDRTGQSAAQPPVAPILRRVRPTLLIADDDPVMRSVLGAQLSDAFLIVAVARDATEAVALAAEHRPDAVLLDVEMPGGGARAAVPAIDARSPGTCIVILSGDESHQIVVELVSGGAISYIRKGVGRDCIIKALNDALAVKSLARCA